tara:strand:- start:10 stop:330 length:321 start_codon:yes stop_codon:yes gene_type:complete
MVDTRFIRWLPFSLVVPAPCEKKENKRMKSTRERREGREGRERREQEKEMVSQTTNMTCFNDPQRSYVLCHNLHSSTTYCHITTKKSSGSFSFPWFVKFLKIFIKI